MGQVVVAGGWHQSPMPTPTPITNHPSYSISTHPAARGSGCCAPTSFLAAAPPFSSLPVVRACVCVGCM